MFGLVHRDFIRDGWEYSILILYQAIGAVNIFVPISRAMHQCKEFERCSLFFVHLFWVHAGPTGVSMGEGKWSILYTNASFKSILRVLQVMCLLSSLCTFRYACVWLSSDFSPRLNKKKQSGLNSHLQNHQWKEFYQIVINSSHCFP